MMPVSQLAVLVSYNFRVQLVGSDLARWCRLRDRGEAERAGRLRLQQEKRQIEQQPTGTSLHVRHLLLFADISLRGRQKSPPGKGAITHNST